MPVTPKVSVVAITYDHEEFIADALDGFVAQQTDFPVEVIVSDDCSRDGTAGIVRDYASRHPDLFVPILRSENVGIHANLVGALQVARGEYVALCEGDDYWTDPAKLQRQADLLDSRREVSLCAHPVTKTWQSGEEPDTVWPAAHERTDLSFHALVRENFIPTNSVMARRLPDYSVIPRILPLDWYLHMRHARGAEVAMLDEVMGVYRRHAGGVWYGSYSDPAAFWTEKAPAMAGFAQAVLELLRDDGDALEATREWTEWVARLVGGYAQEHSADEVADLLAATPDLTVLMARSYGTKAEALDWHFERVREQSAEVARLERRVRKLRRRNRSLVEALEEVEERVDEQTEDKAARRWPRRRSL